MVLQSEKTLIFIGYYAIFGVVTIWRLTGVSGRPQQVSPTLK